MAFARVFVALVLLCAAPSALAMEAALTFEKPEAASRLGSWAKVDGLDTSWETPTAANEEDQRKYEPLEISIELSPVSAHLADSHRTKKAIETLYLRVADEAGAERFYRLSNIVVMNFVRAPTDRPQAMETVTLVAERIERVK